MSVMRVLGLVFVLLSVSPALAIQKADWMAELYSSRAHTQLVDVAIPGTHQSGSYQISVFSQVEPGENLFYNLVRPLVAVWSKAQFRSLRQQLIAGIRFLDLRVAFDSQGQALLTHGLVSMPLKSALNEISSFMIEHPKEVILISSKLSYGYRRSLEGSEQERVQSEEMRRRIEDHFQEKLISFSRTRSFSDFWSHGASVMLMDYYQDFWANRYEIDPLKAYLDDQLSTQNLNEFRNVQMIFTPPQRLSFFVSPRYGFPLFSEDNSLSLFSRNVHDQAISWITDWVSAGNQLNIVTIDFFDRIPFVDALLELNLPR